MHCDCVSVPNANRLISVIVPVLNEAVRLPHLIEELSTFNFAQIIIVDGGSSDGSQELLSDLPSPFQAIDCEPGRAQQMNMGAGIAAHDVLLFLHADTQLPTNAVDEILRAKQWGRFNVRFASASIAMKVVAVFMNLRSRLTGVATGDQAIFVERTLFESIGGFPAIPLMEDVAISKLLKHQAKPYCSNAQVTTSARRWQEQGVAKTVLQMWWYRFAFFFGMSPEKLKQGYRDVR